MKQIKNQPITVHPAYAKIKQNEDQMQLKLKTLENKLSCCQRAFDETKNRPITQHPNYQQLIAEEQKKLLTKIKAEQSKCRPSQLPSSQLTTSSQSALNLLSSNLRDQSPVTDRQLSAIGNAMAGVAGEIANNLTSASQRGGKKKQP